MSNPFTRSGMALYPEDAGNKLEEVWHGDKMLRDIPDHLLSPTIRHNGTMYYVDELVQCSDGSWFLPKRWLTRNGGKSMFASGFHVTESDVCIAALCAFAYFELVLIILLTGWESRSTGQVP